MKADPTRQNKLLELQQLDTKLAQLDHRAKTLPEHAEVASLAKQQDDLDAEVVKTETAHGDVKRVLSKAEADVAVVRERAERNRKRLDAGQGSAKDLQGMQHELESLARRQGVLEDEELEVMEQAEIAEAEAESAVKDRDAVVTKLSEVVQRRDATLQEIAAEREQVLAGREDLIIIVGSDLMALYERLRAHSGTGAAPLVRRCCGGCQIEINPVELSRIKAADEDEVLRCEECSRILVRTPESGLAS